MKRITTFLFLILSVHAQDADDLNLIDESDLDIITDTEKIDLDDVKLDDLEALKNDIGEELENPLFKKTSPSKKKIRRFMDKKQYRQKKEDVSQKEMDKDIPQKKTDMSVTTKNMPKEENTQSKKIPEKETKGISKKQQGKPVKQKKKLEVFDTGKEEKKLLEISKLLMEKIPQKDWMEISSSSKSEKYVVQKGDWLWNISKKIFGTGFYYSKIWSLNPHITNPHEIEPGMILVFNTGDEDTPPQVQVKKFSDDDSIKDDPEPQITHTHEWHKRRKELIDQGIFFQYASEVTYDDLEKLTQQQQLMEYKKYEPEMIESLVNPLSDKYGKDGFDKSSRIEFDFSEGFFLTTFVTTNIIQDLGEIMASSGNSGFITLHDDVFVRFDDTVKVRPGDYFSTYSAQGKSSHPISDREGYRYTITAQIRVLERKEDLWRCQLTDVMEAVERGSRITIYTPKIGKIIKTFSERTIEGAIIDTFHRGQKISYGNVVYIDRGRIDGVENGTVFEVFSSTDEVTGKQIIGDGAYRIGELTAITVSDNFTTALVTNSVSMIELGNIAISKSQQSAINASRKTKKDDVKKLKNLDELDVELNLDDINQNILKEADKIELTDDELEELERQERERSIIKEHERDIMELDKLEKEIEESEKLLNQSKIDEDKYLEQQNLNTVEKKMNEPKTDAFESLNEIEKDIGLKFMDEDLNAKENPYGLTEFDIEEINELMDKEIK